MENSFMKYLFYMVLIIFCLSGIIVLIITKIRKRTPVKEKKSFIAAGSVSAFFDREGHLTIIAYVKDKYGVGRATGNPIYLSYPYSKEILGQHLRRAMKLCESGVPCSDYELMTNLGFIGWKEFTDGRRNISVHYQQGYGVVFNTTIRKADGSYQFNYTGFENTIKNDATDAELGEMLLKLLPKCRAEIRD